MHKLSGLKRGDIITLSKENLPGAVLFPALVCKQANIYTKAVGADHQAPNGSGDLDYKNEDGFNDNYETRSTEGTNSISSLQVTNEHRFLAITRERFLVLDSGGKGVGHPAVVKSNNHLTEV
jgi:hypothetical protein